MYARGAMYGPFRAILSGKITPTPDSNCCVRVKVCFLRLILVVHVHDFKMLKRNERTHLNLIEYALLDHIAEVCNHRSCDIGSSVPSSSMLPGSNAPGTI